MWKLWLGMPHKKQQFLTDENVNGLSWPEGRSKVSLFYAGDIQYFRSNGIVYLNDTRNIVFFYLFDNELHSNLPECIWHNDLHLSHLANCVGNAVFYTGRNTRV